MFHVRNQLTHLSRIHGLTRKSRIVTFSVNSVLNCLRSSLELHLQKYRLKHHSGRKLKKKKSFIYFIKLINNLRKLKKKKKRSTPFL